MIGVVNSNQNNMSAQFIVKSDDVHGGDESQLTPEQREQSRRNNSREAFNALKNSIDGFHGKTKTNVIKTFAPNPPPLHRQ
jgi:hypothetical protein